MAGGGERGALSETLGNFGDPKQRAGACVAWFDDLNCIGRRVGRSDALRQRRGCQSHHGYQDSEDGARVV